MTSTTPEIWFPHLGIKINSLSRVAVTIFGFPIYWYGVIIVAGVLAGVALAVREAKRTGQNKDLYYDYLFIGLACSLVGARLYYVIFTWDDYKDDLLQIFAFRSGGLAIYGGVIAAFISAPIYTHVRKMSFRLFADTAAPSLLLGQAIGRWGNFFNREAFGGYTDSLFAMRYLPHQVDFDIPPGSLLTANGVEYMQVHPTFLYESVLSIIVVVFMCVWRRKYKRFDGEIVLMYLLGYGLIRFFIEGMRTDQLKLFNTQMPVSQLLSAVIAVAAAVMLAYNYVAARRKTQPLTEETGENE